MMKIKMELTTPLGQKIEYFTIDEAYLRANKLMEDAKLIDYQTYHYRDDMPSYELLDGTILHKFVYYGHYHIFKSRADFDCCFKKRSRELRFFEFYTYHETNSKTDLYERLFYYFDINLIQPVDLSEYILTEYEDEYYVCIINKKDGHVFYLSKPHHRSGYWFENMEIFKEFYKYWCGLK